MKKKKIYKIVGISAIVLCVSASYLNIQNSVLSVTNYTLKSDKISKNFDGFKIVQISDFHNVEIDYLKNTIIAKLESEKPDLIVFTGDTIDSARTDIDCVTDFIERIENIAPIFYITGNHEAYALKSYKALRSILEEKGIIFLDNKVELIERNGEFINIVGIDDPRLTYYNGLNSNADIVRSEVNSIDYDKALFTVLLSHRPELFDIYVSEKIDLVLTGHAHGGQIRLPFIGGLYVPNQGWFPKYTSGIFIEDNTHMIISRGIGNSRFPFRVNNRPELVVVELKAK